MIHGVYSLFQRLKMKKSLVSVNAICFPSRATTVRAENLVLYFNYHTKPFCLKTPDQYRILTRQSFEKFDEVFLSFDINATRRVLSLKKIKQRQGLPFSSKAELASFSTYFIYLFFRQPASFSSSDYTPCIISKSYHSNFHCQWNVSEPTYLLERPSEAGCGSPWAARPREGESWGRTKLPQVKICMTMQQTELVCGEE